MNEVGATHCPLCARAADPRLLAYAHELRTPIVHLIRRQRPTWQPAFGICPHCATGFAQALAQERSPVSLHTTTEPHGTFPYYHPLEETVLAQPERLPDYAGIDGAGVTIAFLDSGYFPHPDFSQSRSWSSDVAWETLNWRTWQTVVGPHGTRMVEYVDLADDRQDVGLENASLWDSALDSWHGEMTSAIAAGNGLLSQGQFRGYASGASLLPIKIGRANGRIPETDIRSGLEWLLHDDRWARYGVRVLNVSVGGDFVQPWQENPVCQAVEELVRRGLFVAAASGNSNRRRLLAPAQSPNVLTVGGLDDSNRRWRPDRPNEVAQLQLYGHNYGRVMRDGQGIQKPELLGLGRWLPAPVLPVSPVFREMASIDALRQTLVAGDEAKLERLLHHWVRTLYLDPVYASRHHGQSREAWLGEIWQALRKRMNAHKWIHAYYQHVDGTSVAVAQVSAVAAQMIQANPALGPEAVRSLLLASALPLPHLPEAKRGHGLLMPASAVAAALRAQGGRLAGLPTSGTLFTSERAMRQRSHDVPVVDLRATGVAPNQRAWQGKEIDGHRLRPRVNGGKVASSYTAISNRASQAEVREVWPVYFGLLAPHAHAVSILGSFNHWQPEALNLQPARNGWWHIMLLMPRGVHLYRFWVRDETNRKGAWQLDPENPLRVESGYHIDHCMVDVSDESRLS